MTPPCDFLENTVGEIFLYKGLFSYFFLTNEQIVSERYKSVLKEDALFCSVGPLLLTGLIDYFSNINFLHTDHQVTLHWYAYESNIVHYI